jgi:hypothetical protein
MVQVRICRTESGQATSRNGCCWRSRLLRQSMLAVWWQPRCHWAIKCAPFLTSFPSRRKRPSAKTRMRHDGGRSLQHSSARSVRFREVTRQKEHRGDTPMYRRLLFAVGPRCLCGCTNAAAGGCVSPPAAWGEVDPTTPSRKSKMNLAIVEKMTRHMLSQSVHE